MGSECAVQGNPSLGRVLSEDGGARVTVVFLGGGKRTLDTATVELDLVTSKAAGNLIL